MSDSLDQIIQIDPLPQDKFGYAEAQWLLTVLSHLAALELCYRNILQDDRAAGKVKTILDRTEHLVRFIYPENEANYLIGRGYTEGRKGYQTQKEEEEKNEKKESD